MTTERLIVQLHELIRAERAAATLAERRRCLEWVGAYAECCGCSERIEEAIRRG